MDLFQISIIGKDAQILEVLEILNLNFEQLELLSFSGDLVEFRNQSNIKKFFESYDDCLTFVENLLNSLKHFRINILRVRVLCNYDVKYEDRAMYFEAHVPPSFEPNPTFKIVNSPRVFSIIRKLNLEDFPKYIDSSKIKICIFDSSAYEDTMWFSTYDTQTF